MVLPIHVQSGQFSVEDRSGKEHETGGAASFEGGAGSDVSLKRIVIFLTKKKKTNPLCIFVMWRARLVAFASNFPQRLQRRDGGALMLHSSRALLRLVSLLRRDLTLDELFAEVDKVEEDASAVAQLQAPKQAQASRGRVPHCFMCCLRVAADVKDFLQ